MTTTSRRAALTLIETVTVCALMALLLLTLASGTRNVRQLEQRSACLANLGQIGVAMHAYAAEDPREQAIPIHMKMVMPSEFWQWRTVNWFAWGGQSATELFLLADGAGWWLSDDPNVPPNGFALPEYAANRRPLNGYLPPDLLSTFHCPADTGYPNDPDIDDSPAANAERPCWDTLGNSYRASLICVVETSGGGAAPSVAAFSRGPWGHRLSTLPNQSRLLVVAEPLFGAMLGRDSAGDPNIIPLTGWHGVLYSDNALFCDGSVRLTSVVGKRNGVLRRPIDANALALDEPSLYDSQWVISGPSWQLDCYPTPGAVIFGNWQQEVGFNQWPWKNAYLNPGAATSWPVTELTDDAETTSTLYVP